MKHLISIVSMLLISAFLVSCCSNSNAEKEKTQKEEIVLDFSAGPPIIIYKTKADYFDKVPVTLSDDKTMIVAYPSPGDLFYKGGLSLPIKLDDGYLLDNRGINQNVAFLNITYQTYSELEEVLPLDELFELILDNDPLLEFYNCGNRLSLKNEVEELNHIIKNDGLGKCK